MTVGPVKESQYRRCQSHSEIAMDNEDVPMFRETTTRMRSIQPKGSPSKQAGDDRGRKGSSETTLFKSPKSGEKVESWTTFGVIHHQILKIREEDSHLGEDFGEGLSTKEKLAVFHLASQMDSFILSRPILPCSPLSGKTAIKT